MSLSLRPNIVKVTNTPKKKNKKAAVLLSGREGGLDPKDAVSTFMTTSGVEGETHKRAMKLLEGFA